MMPSMAANATVNLLGVKKETAKVRQHLVMAKGGFLVTGKFITVSCSALAQCTAVRYEDLG